VDLGAVLGLVGSGHLMLARGAGRKQRFESADDLCMLEPF